MISPTMPENWYTYHSVDCGTRYRGCAPDCPKDIWERTGVWTGVNAHQATLPATSTGTTTTTACKRCGQLIFQGITHMCPDFDEPMEFVDSKRLRELEALEAAVNALSATHTMDEANELNERQYHALWSALGPLVNSIYVPMHQRICPACGAPMQASAPAQPAPDANIANEPKPSGYMGRKKML